MPSYKAGTSTGANTMLTPNGVKTSSTTDKASKSYQDSLKKNTSETDKNTKAKQKSTQVFDWVARRLQYFADKTKAIADTITDYVSYKFANIQLGKQIKAVQKEITANQKGEKTYMAKANSIAKKYTYTADKGKTQSVSIPKEYINKVKKGAWKIEDMDTSTTKGKALAEAIQKYQEYYDKAQDCADATRELTQTEKELRVQRLENIAANYDAKASLKASRISNIQSSMGVDKALGKTYGTTYVNSRNKEIDAENKKIKAENKKNRDNYYSAKNDLKKLSKGGNVDLLKRPVIDASKLVKAGWKDAGTGKATVFTSTYSNAAADKKKKNGKAMNFTPIVTDKNGNVTRILTENELQKYAEKVIAGGKDTLKLKIGKTYKGKNAIADAVKGAEKIHDLQDTYYLGWKPQDAKELLKPVKKQSEEQQYKSMINASQDQQKYLEKKKTSVTKEFNSLVAKGTIKKGSAEWYKWKEDIAAIDDEINQCAVDQAEWNDAIANIPLNKKKDEFTALQVDAEKLNDEIALKNTKGIKTSAADYQKLIDNSESQVANLKDQNVLLQEQLSKTDVGTDKYNELLGKINDNNDAIRNAEQSQVEWNNAIANIPLEKIQEALDKLDALGALYESANNLKSKMGQDLTVDDYDTQIQNNIDKIAQEENNIAKYSQYGEFAQMETYAKKAKESGAAYNGKTYTEWMTTYYNALKEQGLNNGKEFNEWLTGIEKEGLDGKFDQKSFDEWNTEIDKTKTNINNLKAANEDLKDTKRDDVYWRDFERAHEAAQRLKEEIDGIAGLISDDMIFDADGKLTDFGLSKVATNVKDLEIARGEVQKYTEGIQNLYNLKAQGYYDDIDEFNEKLAEQKQGLLDSAAEMKNYTDAIMDMYKSMGQAELDSLFEVIDARKEALTAKKSYYDYDKSLKAKNKNIQSLKAEIAALEGIATASSKAELAKKRAELADAQGELDDMIVDHQMELSQTALDGMKESLQDAFDDKWQNMHSDLGAIADLMESANTLVKSSTSDINANLNELLKYYGINPVATGIDPTNVTKHASGAKRVGYNGFGITQEAGREIVLKDGSVLLPLKASDGIIPNQLTENLFKMAKDYPFMNASVPQTITPIVNLKTEGMGGNVTYYFDSLINVEGNLDSVTGKEVIDIIKAQMPSISQYTRKDIVKDAGKAGVRF